MLQGCIGVANGSLSNALGIPQRSLLDVLRLRRGCLGYDLGVRRDPLGLPASNAIGMLRGSLGDALGVR